MRPSSLLSVLLFEHFKRVHPQPASSADTIRIAGYESYHGE